MMVSRDMRYYLVANLNHVMAEVGSLSWHSLPTLRWRTHWQSTKVATYRTQHCLFGTVPLGTLLGDLINEVTVYPAEGNELT